MCCCNDFKRFVVENAARTAPTTDPVVLTVNRPLADLPTNHPFDLYIPQSLLVNETYFTVQLSDGSTTLSLLDRCGSPVRYDSLMNYCCGRDCPCGYLHLQCCLRSDPTPGHVCVLTCLPRSSYVAPATAPAAGGAA